MPFSGLAASDLLMRIKFCGTASLADLRCAVAAECDAVGFIMGVIHRSSDVVTPAEAARMIRQLPPFIEPVAVTHLQETQALIDLVRESHCTTLQVQNDIDPSDLEVIRQALPCVKIVKAVHVMDRSSIAAARRYEPYADAILLDTRTEERIGGTGIPHDWNISAEIVANSTVPVILAGGLTPENVRDAIQKVRPYAVDVHTGVKKDGARNLEKTLAFARAARTATGKTAV